MRILQFIMDLACGSSFRLIGRRFFGKIYIADKNCNACGICVKSCPANVISIKGILHKKPFWNFNCENCNRCINLCPKKAIQVSTLRLILHMTTNIALFVICFRLLPVFYILISGFLGTILTIIADAALFFLILLIAILLQFYILDRFFFLLEQIPFIGKIFEASYTRNFNRYIAPGFNPLKCDKGL